MIIDTIESGVKVYVDIMGSNVKVCIENGQSYHYHNNVSMKPPSRFRQLDFDEVRSYRKDRRQAESKSKT